MDDHGDGVKVRTRLELEPNVSVMKCARNKTTCARSVELFVDVHVVKRHAIVDVLCRPVVNVVIGVHIVVLFVPLVVVHFVVLILLVVILYQFIQLFTRSHFSHMFSLYSHSILGVIFTSIKSRSICSRFYPRVRHDPKSCRASILFFSTNEEFRRSPGASID